MVDLPFNFVDSNRLLLVLVSSKVVAVEFSVWLLLHSMDEESFHTMLLLLLLLLLLLVAVVVFVFIVVLLLLLPLLTTFLSSLLFD